MRVYCCAKCHKDFHGQNAKENAEKCFDSHTEKFKEILRKVGRGELEITESDIVGNEIWFKVKKKGG